jgi:non-heme chloroperoxidase
MPYLLSSDGVPLHYSSHGQGPVIFLLHGWLANGAGFRKNVQELSASHRVVTMDIRGHGRSGKHEQNLTMPQAARDVRAIMEALDLRDVTLVGWSMGSTVMFNYLDQFGNDRLRALSIIEMTPRVITEEGWEYASFQNTMDMRMVMELFRDIWVDRIPVMQRFVSQALFAIGTVPDAETIDEWVDAFMMTPPAPLTALWISAICQDWRSLLPRIELPVLLCYATKGAPYGLGLGPYMHAQIRNSTLVMFEKSGHALFWEEPKKFNTELGRFVDTFA